VKNEFSDIVNLCEKEFPDAKTLILVGSKSFNCSTDGSDIDILVFSDFARRSFQMHYSTKRYPSIDLIIIPKHEVLQYIYYDILSLRGALVEMLKRGVIIKDENNYGREIMDYFSSHSFFYPKMTDNQIKKIRIEITDSLADLQGTRSVEENIFSVFSIVDNLVKINLDSYQILFGSGKTRIRRFREAFPELNNELMAGVKGYICNGSIQPFKKTIIKNLTNFGGYINKNYSTRICGDRLDRINCAIKISQDVIDFKTFISGLDFKILESVNLDVQFFFFDNNCYYIICVGRVPESKNVVDIKRIIIDNIKVNELTTNKILIVEHRSPLLIISSQINEIIEKELSTTSRLIYNFKETITKSESMLVKIAIHSLSILLSQIRLIDEEETIWLHFLINKWKICYIDDGYLASYSEILMKNRELEYDLCRKFEALNLNETTDPNEAHIISSFKTYFKEIRLPHQISSACLNGTCNVPDFFVNSIKVKNPSLKKELFLLSVYLEYFFSQIGLYQNKILIPWILIKNGNGRREY
jgi:hypothetical protein